MNLDQFLHLPPRQADAAWDALDETDKKYLMAALIGRLGTVTAQAKALAELVLEYADEIREGID